MAWFRPHRRDDRPTGAPETPDALRAYAGQYSETRFWTKMSRVFKRAGYELLEKALWLHYAARRTDTPAWARATAYGALAYFILPFDAIPDWLVGYGFTDDLGAITLAVATISRYIDADVRRRATAKLDDWFGRPSHRRPMHTVK
ncbi:YkvA family protein [Salinisphaera sp. RV14]|uniref:YkvA family protein n=1 Tax=unclassified Salinisphaera TaxID=2649847 RepID=UPI003F839640